MWESLLWEMIAETRVGQKSWSKLSKSQCTHAASILGSSCAKQDGLSQKRAKGRWKTCSGPPSQATEEGMGSYLTPVLAVLRKRDRYLPVISSGIDSHAHWLVLKRLEELNSMYENCGSQKYTKQLKHFRFFHETRWFVFNVFERTGTSDCLILQ